ncbi:hypothetical protein J4Q44_G00179900 [Coregonus suidteri]|uniref:Uncharacterized protein n=1 Tax=Coregonus suidteri TaxID=861788 RepID=A0AAN8LWR9_9TELE
MEKEMQCDEIKKIDDEHIQFRRSLAIEMLKDLEAIKQSEADATQQRVVKREDGERLAKLHSHCRDSVIPLYVRPGRCEWEPPHLNPLYFWGRVVWGGSGARMGSSSSLPPSCSI